MEKTIPNSNRNFKSCQVPKQQALGILGKLVSCGIINFNDLINFNEYRLEYMYGGETDGVVWSLNECGANQQSVSGKPECVNMIVDGSLSTVQQNIHMMHSCNPRILWQYLSSWRHHWKNWWNFISMSVQSLHWSRSRRHSIEPIHAFQHLLIAESGPPESQNHHWASCKACRRGVPQVVYFASYGTILGLPGIC